LPAALLVLQLGALPGQARRLGLQQAFQPPLGARHIGRQQGLEIVPRLQGLLVTPAEALVIGGVLVQRLAPGRRLVGKDAVTEGVATGVAFPLLGAGPGALAARWPGWPLGSCRSLPGLTTRSNLPDVP